MRKTVRKLKVPHKLVYVALAVIYASMCFGVDKATVSAMVAVCYAILASD